MIFSAAMRDIACRAVTVADAIVSAVNVSECVITRDHLHARCARADRPLFVVDLSMPPSVELTESVGIRRIDLGVIELATRANREQRAAEAPRVEVVIERELAWLRRWAAREGLRQARSRRCDHETTRGVGAES